MTVCYLRHPEFTEYLVGDDGTVFSFAKGIRPILVKGAADRRGYRRVYRGKGKGAVYLHVLVAQTHLVAAPEKIEVHHINHDQTDNNVSNLQWVTPLENKSAYARTLNEDGTWGYTFQPNRKSRKKWRAQIKIGAGKNQHIGYYATKQLAADAFKRQYFKLHGSFPF